MTEILEKPYPSEMDWEDLERQLHEGGGNFGDDGDGGRWDDDGDEYDGKKDISFGAAMGTMVGVVGGFMVGGISAGYYDNYKIQAYFKNQHIAVPPRGTNAWQSAYEKSAHNNTELGLVMGPIFLGALACAAIGHKIEKHFKNR